MPDPGATRGRLGRLPTSGGRGPAAAVGIVVLALSLVACGGSRKSSSTTTTPTKPTSTTPAYVRPIHATLVGENHAPTANKNWTYSITVTDARGQKLSGTETTQYLYNGVVVGTEKPENVPFKNGYYNDTIQFPAEAVGHPLVVQAVVHTSIGSIDLDWAIEVKT